MIFSVDSNILFLFKVITIDPKVRGRSQLQTFFICTEHTKGEGGSVPAY